MNKEERKNDKELRAEAIIKHETQEEIKSENYYVARGDPWDRHRAWCNWKGGTERSRMHQSWTDSDDTGSVRERNTLQVQGIDRLSQTAQEGESHQE